MENKQYVGFWDRFHAVLVMGILLTIVEMLVSYVFLDDIWMSEIELFGINDIIIGHLIPMIITVYLWVKYMSDFGKMLYNWYI